MSFWLDETAIFTPEEFEIHVVDLKYLTEDEIQLLEQIKQRR